MFSRNVHVICGWLLWKCPPSAPELTHCFHRQVQKCFKKCKNKEFGSKWWISAPVWQWRQSPDQWGLSRICFSKSFSLDHISDWNQDSNQSQDIQYLDNKLHITQKGDHWSSSPNTFDPFLPPHGGRRVRLRLSRMILACCLRFVSMSPVCSLSFIWHFLFHNTLSRGYCCHTETLWKNVCQGQGKATKQCV